MTPTTSYYGLNLVAACANAGYHVELAGGGLSRPSFFKDRITTLLKKLRPGAGIALNLLYLNAKQWGFQFPLACQMRKDGFPIESITIAAGVPSADVADSIIRQMRECGMRYASFKPGSKDAILNVLAIARANPDYPVVLRKLDTVPWYARPIAWALARKEIRGLRAVQGIDGCPTLVRVDRTGLLRSWTRGTPLQLAQPSDAPWYRDAKRLLREMRRKGVTHNDIAKPQNWLMTPEGRAAVIDFQLASVHRRPGRLFRVMAREDLRHLLRSHEQRAASPPTLRVASRRHHTLSTLNGRK